MTTEHLYADHPQTAAGRRQAGLVWTLLPVLLLAASPSPDWSRYGPGRLGDLVLAHPRVQKTLVLTSVPIRAAVQYSGRLRPMGDETQRFIATWAKAMSLPSAPATFHREVLVLEDGIEYWLAVQDVVADAMIRELEPGQAIEIFAVYAGQSLHDHVFLVNEFMTAGKQPADGRGRGAGAEACRRPSEELNRGSVSFVGYPLPGMIGRPPGLFALLAPERRLHQRAEDLLDPRSPPPTVC